jgi:hypothetical protein
MEAHPSQDEHLAALMAEGKARLESQSGTCCLEDLLASRASPSFEYPPGFPAAIHEVLETTMGPRANSRWAGPGGGPRWPWNRGCIRGCGALDWKKEEALVCISQ